MSIRTRQVVQLQCDTCDRLLTDADGYMVETTGPAGISEIHEAARALAWTTSEFTNRSTCPGCQERRERDKDARALRQAFNNY